VNDHNTAAETDRCVRLGAAAGQALQLVTTAADFEREEHSIAEQT
jgi:hypothetical protein